MPSAPISGTGRTIALVVHPDREKAHELARSARAWWEGHGHTVLEDHLLEGLAAASGDVEKIDLAISLGGDGTMLRTIQLGVRASALVLGVHLGNLGYLTQVEPGAMHEAFERLAAGDYEVEERMILETRVRTAQGEISLAALNEAVIEKISSGHTIHVQASIDGRRFLSYAADGILVASPTGSTAYNLSLRGPIVSPRMRCLILTPISPHMLFDRSLVLDPDESVRLEVLPDRPAVLVVDGIRVLELVPGDVLELCAGAVPARVVGFGSLDFYDILRAKFGLTNR